MTTDQPSPSVPVESREQPSGHRVNIETAVEYAVLEMLDDPGGRDVEVERDNLLSVIYCWRDEQLTDIRRERDRARDLAAHLEQELAEMEQR